MPPRTPQKKHPSKSLTLDPSDFQTPSKPATDSTQTKSESSDPNQHRETFDLNEPYCDELEHEGDGDGGAGGGGGSYSQVKQEIEVREVREVEDGNRINNNSNNNEKNEIRREEVEVPANRERRKQKEYEVFVGGLDRDAVEEDLEKVFKKMGEIVEVRLVKNKFSQKNKGFAFVRFATIEQAKRAAAELNYTQVRGKVCEVTRNNDNETLHLGNICPTWTTETLVEKLRPYELENLEDVHLIEDPKDRRRNRGYAFLNFNNHMDAVAACNKLQKGSLYLGTTVRADIAFAKSAVEPDEETMSQVKSIFIDGLPPSWDEEQVQQQFQKFGVIDNVQLARNMPSAKRRDFGFISFRTREAALACIDTVNRDGIGEGAQKISVRATLRKPLQRRMSSGPGGYRGYSSDHYDRWDARSGGVGRSYSNREYRTYEPLGRGEGRGRRISGYSRYSGRGDASRRDVYDSELPPAEKYGGYSRYSTRDAFETESSPVEEYGSQFRRGVVRQVPTTSHSRPRGAYVESGSSSRRSSRNYEDFPPSYTRVSTHEQYDDDDGYGLQYEYYENNSPDMYDYPAPSRMKRPYSAVDDEPLVSRSLARRSRSGERDMDVYPMRGVSSYEEYARSMPDTHYGYDSTGYESRYSSGRGAPRSYDY